MPSLSATASDSLDAVSYLPQRQDDMLPESVVQSSPGLHGAAHLLRGFAGASPSRVSQIPLLGPPSVGPFEKVGQVSLLSSGQKGPPENSDGKA
jgi:hypothetical protein